MGHPIVVFTESRVYNLLRILTNESMSVTYLTIERMIFDTLKGTLTTAQSQTDHLKSKARAQTPMRSVDKDSSLDSHTDSDAYRQSGLQTDPGEISSCGESDGNTGMVP